MTEQNMRTEMLLGKQAMETLKNSRVAVFGIGGVGGYASEALVRSGVGAVDLIDRDIIEESNINRQLVADHTTIGKSKVDVMKEMLLKINPDCCIRTHDLFYLPETAECITLTDYDYIVDAIDTVTAKIELITRAVADQIPIISSMGAGNRLDAGAFKVMDLHQTTVDPLAKVMRRELRNRGVRKLKVVCSAETPVMPGAGYDRRTPGSVSFVPPVAGLMMAGEVILDLTGMNQKQ